uniref:Uncharacterized protein n=1 Tax=Musca domestica TaxID=7370 RepID=A0A1I8MCJ8_MUSDO
MNKNLSLFTWAVIALVLSCGCVAYPTESDAEQTTESPIADMALVDTHMKDSKSETEVQGQAKQQSTKADSAQPQTIADFVIHPLIALKPRTPEEPAAEGKQAGTTTTPAPWQLFGFNPAQSLGSSVSSLAGTVSGWLGNRIQIPGLIDTPVGESTTTTTTTTTTPRPDVIVRVQHRPTTRRPLMNNDIPNRPHRFSNNGPYDSEEYYDEYDNDYDSDYDNDFDNNDVDFERGDDDFDNEDDDEGFEDEEEEEEEDEEEERPVRKRRPSSSIDSEEDLDDDEDDDDEIDQIFEDYDAAINNDFFYGKGHASTKRSQNQQSFIQLGQQNLIDQIRQLTRGQSFLESGTGSGTRKGSSTKQTRPQATLTINRNGQTMVIGPEHVELAPTTNNKVSQTTTSSASSGRRPASNFPQPPLTVPLRRKGQPTQYITIPWSQLGIATPHNVVSVTDGIQTQPLILNIPQSALEAMTNPRPNKNKKPIITSDAVPLLAEASLMDVFKPPQIPPARTPSGTRNALKPSSSVKPVIITTKTKQRIRPGTIVEKAPEVNEMENQKDSNNMEEKQEGNTMAEEEQTQFIVIGDDGEAGLGRHAYGHLSEARKFQPLNPYFHILQGQPLNLRRGRDLEMNVEEVAPVNGEEPVKTEVSDAAEKEDVMVMEEPVMMQEEAVMDKEPMMEKPVMLNEPVVVEEPAMVEARNAPVEIVEEPVMMKEEAMVEEPVMMEAMPAAVEKEEVMKVEEPVVMMEEAPLSQNSEQLIPVQVVTSESNAMKSSDAVAVNAKPEEAKTE